MNHRLGKSIIVLSMIFAMLCILVPVMGESDGAQTMRLLRYDGSVGILDATGNPRLVMENVLLSSGEAVKTGENSSASVSLDATKILTLDAETRVEFEKDGDHLVLNLTAGTLLLDVQEKLDENESLDIRTSTMTIGIRGTILYVTTLDRVPERVSALFAPTDMPALNTESTDPSELREVLSRGASEGAGQVSQLGVLQGTVHLSFTDEEGKGHSLNVSSGQKATLIDRNENDLVDTAPDVTDITKDDLEGFLEDTIAKDPEMYEKIIDNTEDILPPIAFFPESAEKVYDGMPLTCRRAKAVGLPEGYTYTCVFPNSQTDAGRCENTILSYRVFNPRGREVTTLFADIAIYPGTLTVYPAPVDITTASESRKYDGTPLTNPEATVNGLAADETITVIPNGTVTYVGTEKNTYTIDWGETNPANYSITEHLGTLEVTPNDTPIRFTAGSGKKVYDGSALTNGYVTVAGLPDIFKYRAITAGSRTKVGSSKNAVTSWQIYDGEGVNVTACFSNITVYGGTLTVEPLEIAFDLSGATVTAYGDLQIPNPSITYMNGAHAGETVYGMRTRSLTAGYHFTLFTGDTVRLTVTAEETEEGTYRLSGEATIPGSEDVSIVLSYIGETEIPRPRELVITTSSASKLYDGTPLTSSEVSVEGLAEGDSIIVTATGTITEPGTAENTYVIDWLDTDPGKYTVTDSLGILEIRENTSAVIFSAASGEKVYDGTELADSTVTASGLPAGFTYVAAASGSQKDAGESANAVTFYKIYNAENVDVTASFTDIIAVDGTLTVTPAEVTVTTGSASKAYDGAPLTNSEASIIGLVAGETATVTATGSITDIGTATNTYSIDWGGTNPDNYTVTESLGTLEVTVSTEEITLTAASGEKVYDGTELTTDEFIVEGTIPDGVEITVTVSGSQKDAGSSDSEITAYAFIAGGEDVTSNFTGITTQKGTLTVMPAPLTINTGSATKAYDGIELRSSEATLTGLVNGETATITATGTITNVGSADNTYSIDWGSVKSTNYKVTEQLGTLTVTTNSVPITIIAQSASKNYDGTELVAWDTEVQGLSDAFWAYGVIEGGQTDAGTSTNKLVEYMIGDREENDVTAYFSNVTLIDGTLTVIPTPLTITTLTLSKKYDGTPLEGGEATVTGLVNGETITVTTSSLTNIGSIENTYTIDWGSVNSNNYTITSVLGTLTVEQVSDDGKITYTWDGTSGTIGLNGNNEYILLDKEAFIAYYQSVQGTMTDSQVLQELLARGIIKQP